MNEPTAKRKASSDGQYTDFYQWENFLEWYPKFTPNFITTHFDLITGHELTIHEKVVC
jgi:hypothetical protein